MAVAIATVAGIEGGHCQSQGRHGHRAGTDIGRGAVTQWQGHRERGSDTVCGAGTQGRHRYRVGGRDTGQAWTQGGGQGHRYRIWYSTLALHLASKL